MKYKAWYLGTFIAILVGIIYVFLTVFSNGMPKMDCALNTKKFLMPDGCDSEFSENPVLQLKCPPAFSKITHANIISGLKCGFQFYKLNFNNFDEEIENGTRSVTWENVIDHLEIMKAPASFSKEILDLLLMVNYSKLLQDVAKELNPLIAEAGELQERSTNFHVALKSLKNQKGLSNFKKAYISRTLDMLNRKIDPKSQKEFEELKQQLYENRLKYNSNIRSSKEELAFLVFKRSEVLGIPDHTLKQMSLNAQKMRNLSSSLEKGPWLITMESLMHRNIRKYSNSKNLRTKVSKRIVQIGCTEQYNNSEVIDRLRTIIERLAHMNGYENYIQSRLENSMAQNSSTVMDFLDKVYNAVEFKAYEKLAHLKSYGSVLGIANVSESDLYYLNNKYLKDHKDINGTEIRKHFPKEHVFNEIFKVIKDIFEIDIRKSKGDDDVYAPNVRFYNVYDVDGEHLGSMYLDIDSRGQSKSSGAWTTRIRRPVPSLNVKPIVLIGTNFDLQETLTVSNIEVFLHELGHALQFILTSIYALNPYSDTQEVPSVFMEYFAYNHKILKRISLPRVSDELLNDIDSQHSSFSGIALLTQIYLGVLDQNLFLHINKSWSTVNANVLNDYKTIYNFHTLCNFKHIFSYGYGGRYYVYLWSEAIALQIHHYLYQDDHSFKEKAMKIRRLVFERKDVTSESEIYETLLGSEIPDVAYLLQKYGL